LIGWLVGRGGTQSTVQEQKNVVNSMRTNTEEIATKVERNTSIGFWTYFIFFQAVFLAAFVWWKKVRDEQNKKFL
jgi:hypothetical protein